MNLYIKIPIKILTPKIPGKQDSFFYAGKDIAEVKVRDRTYVLTTAGEYRFTLKEPKKGPSGEFMPPRGYISRGLSRAYGFHESADLYPEEETVSFNSSDRCIGAGAPGGRSLRAIAFRTLTDAKIKKLGDNDLISNWGWFGINVWVKTPNISQPQPGNFTIEQKETCLDTPTDVWSEYNEALKAFIDYVEQDLRKESK
jgi:hypothetical protein